MNENKMVKKVFESELAGVKRVFWWCSPLLWRLPSTEFRQTVLRV